MEFQEILAEGPIKIERLATKPTIAYSYTRDEGRVIYVIDEEKIYYGKHTDWSEISSGAGGDLTVHIADTTTHGSNGDIAGDTDVANAITAHSISPSAHPLATTSAPGFLKTLSNDSSQYLNGLGNWVAAEGTATKKTVLQASHGFIIGDLVRLNGGIYVKASAISAEEAEVIGIVSARNSSDEFVLTIAGYVTGLSGLTAGSIYFLSVTAGALSMIEPSSVGYVSKPLLLATSTTEGYFFNWRGSIIAAATIIPDPGIATANQMLILGANKNVDTLAIADGGLKLGSGAGTAVVSTAAEINKLHSAILDIAAVTATAAKVNYLTNANFIDYGITVGGWARLPVPAGLILQWGKFATATQDDTAYTITFPIAFPIACLNSQCTIHNISVGQDVWMGVYDFTKTTATYLCNSDGDGTGDNGFFWFAIGY